MGSYVFMLAPWFMDCLGRIRSCVAGAGCEISKPAPGIASLLPVGQNVELPAIAPAPCVSASCHDDL